MEAPSGEGTRPRTLEGRSRATRNERLADGHPEGLLPTEGPAKAPAVDGEESWGREDLARALRAGEDPDELLQELLGAAPHPLFAQRELLCAAFEHHFGRAALYSPTRWDHRLFAVLERLDRYATGPAKPPRLGAGAAELLEAIEMDAWAERAGIDPGMLPNNPRSLARFVFTAELFARSKGPDARLNRRVARACRWIEANTKPGPDRSELEVFFQEALEPELERRRNGQWCRVRRALRQALDRANRPQIVWARGYRIGHNLFGAHNPRWRKSWRNW